VSYSIDTLTELRRDYPQRSLCLLLGMDAFLGCRPGIAGARYSSLCHVVVAHRPGWKAPITGPLGEVMVDRGTGSVRDLHSSTAGRIYVRAVTQLEIASTDLRALIMSGRTCAIWCRTRCAISSRSGCYAARNRSSPEAEPTRMTTPARPRRVPRRNSVLEKLVLAALDEMKAVNIKLLDVRELTDIADAMIVASGTSDRHVRAIAQRVVEKAREAGRARSVSRAARWRMGAGGPAGRAAARDVAARARVLCHRAALGAPSAKPRRASSSAPRRRASSRAAAH
jgi:ribosome silencing factor RsfS/YbeB/iojap